MKQALLTVLLCVAWILPAQSESPKNPAIEETIARQIDAFKADDFAAAFSFASDGIRQMFGTPERFGQMVQNGYPMVYRPGEINFLELREAHGGLWQTVELRDRAGLYHVLAYEMIEVGAAWKIDAVRYMGKGLGIGA